MMFEIRVRSFLIQLRIQGFGVGFGAGFVHRQGPLVLSREMREVGPDSYPSKDYIG